MKLRKSLTFRLVLSVFLAMALANVITGSWYYLFSLRHYPAPLGLLMQSPMQLLAVSLLLGTLLSTVFSKILMRPIYQLIDATKKVAQGDFTVRVEPTNGEDEMNELVGSFNDMTRELGNNELFKKDFINSFSHEFKTPIVSIRGFARQLQRDDLTEEQRREYVDIIVRESERLSNMSSNVLLLTRLENQRIMPDRKNYSLDEQLREAILLLEKQWTDKELELNLDLMEMQICGNEEMLAHVWINIIGNAVKFSPHGGVLGVRCALKDDRAVVTITDEGPGMDDATKARIFDQFYQGETTGSASPSHSAEGNGLGLPLAKRIVELSGGSISVESCPGKGSSFSVYLPIH